MDGWQKLSLLEIATRAVLHFDGAPLVPARGESQSDAELRRAWGQLADWGLRGVEFDGRRRLVVEKGANPDALGRLSELLGEGIGLVLAERALGVPYTAFSRRTFKPKVKHDYDVTTPNGNVRVELRGRFRR